MADIGGGGGDPGWVPVDACTLPSAQRPQRLDEFAELLRGLRRLDRHAPDWLRLRLADGAGVAERAAELTAREAGCCAFFDFTVRREGGDVVVDVRVPPSRAAVLDGLAALAALPEDPR